MMSESANSFLERVPDLLFSIPACFFDQRERL
jgi:hypothetical protein